MDQGTEASTVGAPGGAAGPGFKLLWDVMGHGGPSGINTFAHELKASLLPFDCVPHQLPGPTGFWKLCPLLSESKWGHPLAIAPQAVRWSRHQKGPVVVHGLNNCNLPRQRRFYKYHKTVLTVHDLIPLIAAHQVSKLSSLQTHYCLRRVLPLVDRVVCVSHWTRRSLLKLFPDFSPNRAVVIPNGFPSFAPRILAHGSSRPCVLTVSRWEPYKNFMGLAEVINQAEDLSFIVVTDHRGEKFLSDYCSTALKRGTLQVAVGVSDSVLSDFYQSAHVYWQPSFLEGFCLPAATAIARAVPVVFMSGSGIDEVCGEEVAIGVSHNAGIEELIAALKGAIAWNQKGDYLSRSEQYVQRQCHWRDIGSRYLQLYQEVAIA
jgi:glycosyltransferase involved in cell wall biosynthesis